MDLTLVIPCYNEAEHLEGSVARLIESCDLLRVDYELIFVDDASTDGTRQLLDRIVVQHPARALRVIAHPVNLGRGAAVSRGVADARAPIAGFLDIDLEVDAAYVAPFYLAVRNGADLAIGRRIYRVSLRALPRFALTRGYTALRRLLLPQPFDDTEAGFKFFRLPRMRPVIEACRDPRWFWDTELVVRAYDAGLRIADVPCLFVRRTDKTSTVRPLRDSWRHLRGLMRLRAERMSRVAGLPPEGGNLASAFRLRARLRRTAEASAEAVRRKIE